jgi:nitroreductase
MAEMGLFEAMYTARALRRLKPDPVPDEIIAKVIDAGIRAASGANNQNWIFVVIKDPDKRERIGELYRRAGQVFMEMYRDAPRPAHMSEKAYARMTASAAYLFEHVHEVPVLLLACLNPPKMVPAKGKLPSEMANAGKVAPRLAGSSIYPAVQNIILACRAFGLGTVLTTGVTYLEEQVKTVLGLPPQVETYALLPIGYPEENHSFGPVRRNPVNQVTFLDSWGNRWPKQEPKLEQENPSRERK